MNVNELRQHDAIESVENYAESHQAEGNSSDDNYWLVTPESDAYEKDDLRLFLWNKLNFLYEYEDGTLKVPKSNIIK